VSLFSETVRTENDSLVLFLFFWGGGGVDVGWYCEQRKVNRVMFLLDEHRHSDLMAAAMMTSIFQVFLGGWGGGMWRWKFFDLDVRFS